MSINTQSATTLLESVLQAEGTRQEAAVAVLKKAQDVQKQQGAAIVDLLEKSGVSPDGLHLDAYA